jgi:surface polysaccharide O-acyltransferase-like enzyme
MQVCRKGTFIIQITKYFKMVQEKKVYIDWLRTIAIFAAVAIHVTGFYYNKFNEIPNTIWWFSNIINSLSRFSVPLFIMISGAVLLGRDITIKSFYKKRFFRLIPPMVFWYSFFVIFRFLISDVTVYDTAKSLIINGKPYYHLWYLTMFFFLMLVAPFINLFINGVKPEKNDLIILLSIFLFLYILNSFSLILETFQDIKITYWKSFALYSGYFIGGYFIDRYGNLFKRNISCIVFTFLITILGAFLNYYVCYNFETVKDYLILSNTSPMVMIITFSIFLFARNVLSFEYKIIHIISNASFGVFLIHPFFLYFTRILFDNLNSSPIQSMSISFFTTLLLSLITITFLRHFRFLRNIC